MIPDVEYVLPLRWAADDPAELTDLTGYLRTLCAEVTVTVVDGSPPPVFAAHAAAWRDLPLRHLPPDPDLDFAMGKVNPDGPTMSGWSACPTTHQA